MTVYIFGVFANGYSQYPNDSTSEIFKKQYSLSKAPTQVAIHRDGNLMYYSYIRKLNSVKYIGISVVLTSKLITKIGSLFSVYENIIEIMANKGYIIHYGDDGKLTTSTNKLFENSGDISVVSEKLNLAFDNLVNSSRELPHVDYSVVKDSVSQFSEKDNANTIIKASHTFSYTYIYKDQDFDTVQINSYKGVLSRVSKERDELRSRCTTLSSQLTKAKVQQRNLIWVSVLGAIALILGVIVWNKVLFPSEVTRYQTEHFLYYGPMQNKKPHGEGVAFYPKDDQDGRRYYIGYFVNGERQDTTAMLYYQNGDYFYGSMDGDKFLKGIFYSNSDKSHFEGSFVDNKPYDGTWYNHEESYKLKDGEMK